MNKNNIDLNNRVEYLESKVDELEKKIYMLQNIAEKKISNVDIINDFKKNINTNQSPADDSVVNLVKKINNSGF